MAGYEEYNHALEHGEDVDIFAGLEDIEDFGLSDKETKENEDSVLPEETHVEDSDALPNESRAIQLTYDVRSTADNEESDDEEEIAAGFIPEDMVEYYNYNTGDAEYMKDSDSNSKGNNDIIMTAVKSDLDHFRTKDAYASRLLQIAESKEAQSKIPYNCRDEDIPDSEIIEGCASVPKEKDTVSGHYAYVIGPGSLTLEEATQAIPQHFLENAGSTVLKSFPVDRPYRYLSGGEWVWVIKAVSSTQLNKKIAREGGQDPKALALWKEYREDLAFIDETSLDQLKYMYLTHEEVERQPESGIAGRGIKREAEEKAIPSMPPKRIKPTRIG